MRQNLVFILLGGDKSRQDAGIAKAKEILDDMKKTQAAGKKKREAEEKANKKWLRKTGSQTNQPGNGHE